MNKILMILIFALFASETFAHGQLFLIGGGTRTKELLQTIIKLADSKKGNILVIPLASEIPEEVARAVRDELLNEKAQTVDIFSCDSKNVDEKSCLEQINKSDLIFFTGGDQNRLMTAFNQTHALELIRLRHQKNDLALAGTSAGTAIMSEIMITGNPLPPNTEFNGIKPHLVETAPGFGFVKKFIVDQHFLKRGRQNRLISTVLDHPRLIGLGIDESTAVLIAGDESFTVFGEGLVTVIDAQNATIKIDGNGNYQTTDIKMSLLGKNSL